MQNRKPIFSNNLKATGAKGNYLLSNTMKLFQIYSTTKSMYKTGYFHPVYPINP